MGCSSNKNVDNSNLNKINNLNPKALNQLKINSKNSYHWEMIKSDDDFNEIVRKIKWPGIFEYNLTYPESDESAIRKFLKLFDS